MHFAIVHGQPLVREILHQVIAELGGEVVAEMDSVAEAVAIIQTARPEILIAGLWLPDGDGLELVKALSEAKCQPRVLLVVAGCSTHAAFRTERARIHGLVDSNTQDFADFRETLSALVAGRRQYSESFHQRQAERFENPFAWDKLLTERERIVLELVAQFLSDDEIAVRLCIGSRTVETHRLAVMNKFEFQSRTELLRFARQEGFMPPASAMVPVLGR